MPPADPGADEFAIIARYFAPLATHEAARDLIDDVALLRTQGDLVLTADAIVEGVHFLAGDPLNMVARKALRVNLSDLAAKGARPLGYLLTLAWPSDRDAREIEALAQGLAEDQRAFGLSLLGGDSVSTPGPLTLAVTMIGAAASHTPARAGAKPGDGVYVTGTIGDAGLGLAALRGEAFGADTDFLADRYRLPQPRVDLGQRIASAAHASMDVSDGLIADAAKMASASGARIEIDLAALPLSPAAARWLARQPDGAAAFSFLASAGDDYEILFAAPAAPELDAERIGTVVAGDGLCVTYRGAPVRIEGAGGFAHRLGR